MIRTPSVALHAVGVGGEWNYTLRDPEDEVVIGRGSGATWRLDQPLLSRRHVRLSWCNAVLEVSDLGSRNGSRLNGTPLRSPMVLAHGDRLEIGPVTVTVSLLSRQEALTIGRPAGVDRTAATRIAPRLRRPWRRWIPVAAALACLGGALLPIDREAPSPPPAPRPIVRPVTPVRPAPRADDDRDVPTGALRRNAIQALAEGRRFDAWRLFGRVAARLPDDRCTALVLTLTRP